MRRQLLAVAAGTMVVATLSGWGQPRETAAADQEPAAARAVRAVTTDAPGAAAAIPADFAAVMGYRPGPEPTATSATATRLDGGCTSPFGETRYGFGVACRSHDLGYDLLRYAEAKGMPLGPWARNAVDDLFTRQLRDRCDGVRCLAAAAVYDGVVRINSWRQGWGTPVIESPVAVFTPAAVGLAVALLLGSARANARVRRLLAPAGRTAARLAAPRAGRLALAATALALCLQPGLLPRPLWVQVVIGAASAVQVYGLATLALLLAKPIAAARHRLRAGSRPANGPAWVARRERHIQGAHAWTGAVLGAAVVTAYVGQLALTRATGMAAPSLGGQLGATAVAAGLALTVIAFAAVLARATAARLSRTGRRRVRPVLAVFLAPVIVFSGSGGAAAAAAPDAGREGRAFLATTPSADRIAAVTGRPARDPLRVYVGRDEAGTATAQADLAVRRLAAAGGFERSAVLIAIPTGSGWVNPSAAAGLEYLYGGDTAVVAAQYSASPSWVAYVRGGEGAQESARELIDAVRARALRQPAELRPKILVYGESLGAWGGLTAFQPDGGLEGRADGALWVGVPAGSPMPAPGGNERVVVHANDPVPVWSPNLLVEPAPGWPGPWYPVVTFWQVTGDVIAALDPPAGHGHRYGPELVDAWRQVAPPEGEPGAAPADRLDDVRRALALDEQG
jgi:uncharacterized membrane protein